MPEWITPKDDAALWLTRRAPMLGSHVRHGIGELLVVLVVVLLVFGPGRLPEMMGNLGKAMREFQKGAARAAGD